MLINEATLRDALTSQPVDIDKLMRTMESLGGQASQHGSALGFAAREGLFEACMQLLRRGAPPEGADIYGTPGCYHLIQHPAALSVALDHGLCVNYRMPLDKQENTLLMVAMEQQAWETGRLLVQRGAEVNLSNASGETALHLAASSAMTPAWVIPWLVEEGACVLGMDRDGKTPLHWAARLGLGNNAMALTLAGAEWKRPDWKGRTPEDYWEQSMLDGGQPHAMGAHLMRQSLQACLALPDTGEGGRRRL